CGKAARKSLSKGSQRPLWRASNELHPVAAGYGFCHPQIRIRIETNRATTKWHIHESIRTWCLASSLPSRILSCFLRSAPEADEQASPCTFRFLITAYYDESFGVADPAQ